MKILNGLIFFFIAALTLSCEENVIQYETAPLGNKAEFQLHYFVPVVAGVANNIYKVEINGKLYANNTASLATYNAVPSGGVSLFYAVDPGTVNIKLYKGTLGDQLVYNQDTELAAGKQNVFVHDFNEPPVVLDNLYPYPTNITADTDSATWVRFYNFLYESAGVPTDLILQYQYLDPRTNLPVNVGEPVAFGEATGWEEVKLIKDVHNSAGTANIRYRIKVVDSNGVVVGDLQVENTTGSMVNYAATVSSSIGRKIHHIFGGIRTDAPVSSVRYFTAN